MMKIIIKNLKVETLIGVYDHERIERKELIYNLELKVDAEKCGVSDDLADALDYDDICEKVREVANSSAYKLLEALLFRLKTELFVSFQPVKQVKISITKPNIIENCESVSVEGKYKRD